MLKRAVVFMLVFLFMFSFYTMSQRVTALADVESVIAPAVDLTTLDSAIQAIREGLLAYAESIDLTCFNLSEDEVSLAFAIVLTDFGHYCELVNNYIGGYSCGGEDPITRVFPLYLCDEETYQQMITDYRLKTKEYEELEQKNEEFELAVSKILKNADMNWTDFEKTLFVHDYLCANFCYDTDYEINDAYQFLKYGRGTCNAYATTALALLERLGVETEFVTAFPKHPEESNVGHAWNLVKIDGKWYHMDATWDDPIPNRFGHAQHNNFLRSDTGFIETGHGVYNWSCQDVITANDTQYDNAYYQGIRVPFAYLNGNWYFIRSHAGFGLYRDDPNGPVLLESFSVTWPTNGIIYPSVGPSTGLFAHDGLLWFNTQDKILTYNPQSGVVETVFEHTDGTSMLRGIQNGLDGIHYATAANQEIDNYSIHKFIRVGDTNGDDLIELNDLTILAKHLAGWNIQVNDRAGDCDGNHAVALSDLMFLAKYIAGWNVTLAH